MVLLCLLPTSAEFAGQLYLVMQRSARPVVMIFGGCNLIEQKVMTRVIEKTHLLP